MSILSTSITSIASQLASFGADTFKAARNAIKGVGQDGKYFSSSKKGAWAGTRARDDARVRSSLARRRVSPPQARSPSCAPSWRPPTWRR